VAAALAAATPSATTMPETVQRRLSAALQLEVHGEPTRPDAEASGSRGSVTQTTVVRSSRRRSAGAGLAAAAAVLVLVGTVVGVRQSSDPVAEGGGDEEALLESSEPAQPPPDPALSGTADSDEPVAALPPIPPPVLDEAQRSDARRADRVDASCGSGVLDAPGDVVVAVAEVTTDPRAGVLVTVDSGEEQVLWWLPACAAGADEAFGRSPRP
jgi:hypothetical protein